MNWIIGTKYLASDDLVYTITEVASSVYFHAKDKDGNLKAFFTKTGTQMQLASDIGKMVHLVQMIRGANV